MRGSKNHQKMLPQITKNPFKIIKISLFFFGFYFYSMLTQFWLHFGSILAPFGTILAQKNILFPHESPITVFFQLLSKLYLILEGFWNPNRLQDLKKVDLLTLFPAFT